MKITPTVNVLLQRLIRVNRPVAISNLPKSDVTQYSIDVLVNTDYARLTLNETYIEWTGKI